MKRELLNSKLIYNYDVDEEFNIDTLLLKDFVVIRKGVNNILEIGSGAGAISLYLSQNPKVIITAIEIQDKRAKRLLDNIQINNLEDKILGICSDIRKHKFSKQFDVIVSNPPFYKVNEKNTNSSISRRIAKEELFLTLEELCISVYKNLKELGSFFLIYPTSRLIELINTFTQNRLTIKRMRFIAPSIEDKPNRVLIEAVKGAKNELKLEKTFFLYDINGEISKELKQIYNMEDQNE